MHYAIPYGHMPPSLQLGDWVGTEVVTSVEFTTSVWDGDDLVPGTIVAVEEPHRVARVKIQSPLGVLWQVSRTCHKTGALSTREFPNISETIEGEETPLEAAVRGLKEELGLQVGESDLETLGVTTEVKPSPTTGLTKAYAFYDFSFLLDQEAESIPLVVNEGDCTIALEWRY